jgi:hypothetical protein
MFPLLAFTLVGCGNAANDDDLAQIQQQLSDLESDSVGQHIRDLKDAWRAKRKLNRNYKSQGTDLYVGQMLENGKLRTFESTRDPSKYSDGIW